MSTTGLLVVVGTLLAATVVGLVLKARNGRVRAARSGPGGAGGWALAGRSPAEQDRVLLLQVSSPVCAPCRQTATLLTELAAGIPELVHVEVDAAERPEVAGDLGIMRTPTVVAFDRSGAELLRVSGVPRLRDLETALAPALGRA
ncbi:thioredoxin family protein [Pseudonocardia acidicola]|uniref:Thioredoxin family protein n=1 Tax=Pseudonocardia acidicola TaxID=2724939 RepID=A0ABX1SE56_9PSEU|nr:thioredoxin family protein [Pseudonocardia acidicola]NMH98641.1 thioredoxin family protein [Pseudonocardia acidicola]